MLNFGGVRFESFLEDSFEETFVWSTVISRRQVASSLIAAKEPRCSSIHKTVEPLLQIQGLVVSGIHDLSQDKAEFKVVV